ncbi:MAG: glycosyltransferase family 4 protein, partial [bacterium]
LITCCPPVGKEELIRYYREADLFALPSHKETFGLVYAEAMSQGLPVVYTRGQGFDGQFPDGAVGYAASDRDARELAEKLLLCAENRPRLSVNALEGAKRFNWDTTCASYVKMYEEMCV